MKPMNTTERANLVIAEQKAEALYKADPNNEENFLNWYNLSVELSRSRYDSMAESTTTQAGE